MKKNQLVNHFTTLRVHALSLGMAIVFASVIFWLNNRQYQTFQLYAPDVAKFYHAIRNTLQGKFLLTTFSSRSSILGYHFTPFFALLSPLILIWPDVRILFMAQIVGLGLAGLILYWLVYEKHPQLAPWLLLAFYLNPALHEVALHELRRVTFAVPFLTLAFYAAYKKNRLLMIVGLAFALLCKEDISILVFMFGIYLIIFEKEWRWGLPLALVGLVWAIVVPIWVIPAFGHGIVGEYQQARYMNKWGDSLGDQLVNIVTNPIDVLSHMFDKEGLKALWRLFMPLGIILPFLAPRWLLIGLPSLALLLLSSTARMHQLENWYLAPLLPIIFGSVAISLSRLSPSRATWAVRGLLGTTIIGFFLYSFIPPGANAQMHRYRLSSHHLQVAEMLDDIPDSGYIAAQSVFLVRLNHHNNLYRYPWFSDYEEQKIDYYVFDPTLDPYPLGKDDLEYAIGNLVADPQNVIVTEMDGVYLIERGGIQHPAIPVNLVAEDTIKLDRVEVAVTDSNGKFQLLSPENMTIARGQTIRVALYWEALAPPNAERTVSVRIVDASGMLVAQQDMLPNHGARPTSWWQTGWTIRDTYYLTLLPQTQLGVGTLDVLLYDTYTQVHVPFANNSDVLHIVPIQLVDAN